MLLKKDSFLFAVYCATILLGTRVQGSDNASDPAAAEPEYGIEDALKVFNYTRSEDNISKLVDAAKVLIHGIYGCENGTIGCPASFRMTDMLFGVLIASSEDANPTEDILAFLSDIIKVAGSNCPSRHRCICTTKALYNRIDTPEEQLILKARIREYVKKIGFSFGCIEAACGKDGIGSPIARQAVFFAIQNEMDISYRAILDYLDELLYLIRPCSNSCTRIEDGCSERDFAYLVDRWDLHKRSKKTGHKLKKQESKEDKGKKVKRKRRKVKKQRNRRRNFKNKRSKRDSSSMHS